MPVTLHLNPRLWGYQEAVFFIMMAPAIVLFSILFADEWWATRKVGPGIVLAKEEQTYGLKQGYHCLSKVKVVDGTFFAATSGHCKGVHFVGDHVTVQYEILWLSGKLFGKII